MNMIHILRPCLLKIHFSISSHLCLDIPDGLLVQLVINFSLKRKSLLQKFTRDQHAYGNVCMGASSVRRWVKHFKDGNTSIQDQLRSGHPRTALTERNKERVDEIIQDNRRVTVDTRARTLGIGHCAVQEMIESVGYRKVCAHWVPRLLTEDYKDHHLRTAAEISTQRQ